MRDEGIISIELVSNSWSNKLRELIELFMLFRQILIANKGKAIRTNCSKKKRLGKWVQFGC